MSAVHLVDEGEQIGGSMRAISAYPNLGEWARVTQHRQIQLDKLANVEVIPKTRLDAENILTYGAEIVVLATGSAWRADGMTALTPLPGAELDSVYTPEQVSAVSGAIDGDHVLVYDADSYFTGVAMAEMLLAAGKRVTVVTPAPNFAQYMFFTGEAFRINRGIRTAGATVVTDHLVTEIGPGSARGQSVWSPDPVEWEADAVVLVTERQPRDGLYHELTADPERLAAEEIEAVYRIGDCVAPRLIAECVFDGHRLAREIDSADPATPLPFARELPEFQAVAEATAPSTTASEE
jgi:dimethylamine/trimethylamine dehydrogenase